MIEKDLKLYYEGQSTLTSLIGNKIYVIQAPQASVTMPWLVIENTSGSRIKIAQDLMEETAYLRVTVDTGPNQFVSGRNIIETAKNLIENYRGNMGSTNDLHITCGSIRGWAGIGGAYRFQFDIVARFTETYAQP